MAPLHFGVFFSHGLWGGSHSTTTPFCICDNRTSTTANHRPDLHGTRPKINIAIETASMIDRQKVNNVEDMAGNASRRAKIFFSVLFLYTALQLFCY